ncbi:PHP domain-containing protein [Aneurinibacillus aneurinilyticus]|jgi:predicted metal-dependent phosphoesterase TrpH|uniref:PHP domain-containing protein n=1 Tax=Aneurinibacillus aneurinilyticus TaxID=1391 RepID=UPI0023F7D8DE|nr:PHP domain-containing protein [Aneurinibacillus aneurinilyticus]MCI1692219.1 PHP domain-containing protein [Aneurinibacillus aneurinilyticus]
MNKADLHSHTTASDGTYSVRQSIERAKANGLAALGITDHDTIAALASALEEGKRQGIEIVPGVEISSVYSGKDVHVLGYYMDINNCAFLQRLEELREVRGKRNRMMIEKLNELGISITMEEVERSKKEKAGNIGRPHMAEVLMEKGVVTSMKEAFDKYLGSTGAAYVNPPRISPEEAIDIIQEAGGVAVLAHPGLYKNPEMVRKLIKHGLQGIEVYHPDNDEEDTRLYEALADEYHLVKTAGSDFHGMRGTEIFHADLGAYTVTMETVHHLRELSGAK